MQTRSPSLPFACIVLLACVALAAQAQGEPRDAPDATVAKILEDAAVAYRVDEDGDFRVVYDTGGGRTQLLWIPSRTSAFGAVEVRQVWSVAHRAQGPLPADLANRLLERNGDVILGAWLIQPADAQVDVIFAVQVASQADALSLRSAMHAVATTADAMEKELTGRDEF